MDWTLTYLLQAVCPDRCSYTEWLSLQVFDILPLYGELSPYSSFQVAFTFYGHCDIIAQAKALCKVEGGPTYEITLRGEASMVNYSFDTKDINYGLQVLPPIGSFPAFALYISNRPGALISLEPRPHRQESHHLPYP